ncbi:MAG: radical SAM family heme chaperone HemW [Pseudomonadota bacterium]|nr:radical SAM family heme chaperone HemW [Pseudomonadota bacterium]
MNSASQPGFGVYVHWPFCVSKCPYCDFNSHVRETVDQSRWADALVREIGAWAGRVGRRPVSTVFFGGGTPSLMPASTVAAVLDAIGRHFGMAPDVEVTLEANPSSVEVARFRDFRAAGINRVSIGVQSLDPVALTFLSRAHDTGQALAAIAAAAEIFGRFSFDLIYALPGQTAADWSAMLERALDLGAAHLSLYQLTIEPNTGFAGDVKRGRWRPMDDDNAADLFERTQDRMARAGMPAYETSNHARPGEECRHNLLYWRYGAWIGIGPGAHGRPLDAAGRRFASANLKRPETWLEAVETTGRGLEAESALDPAEQAEEALMMGLRLAEGVDRVRFLGATGTALDDVIDRAARDRLVDDGVLADDGRRLVVTPSGRLLLNTITGRLLAATQDRGRR